MIKKDRKNVRKIKELYYKNETAPVRPDKTKIFNKRYSSVNLLKFGKKDSKGEEKKEENKKEEK